MNQEKNDWALAVTRICSKFLTTGNVGWLVVSAPIIIVLIRFSYNDIRNIVTDITTNSLFAVIGWGLFILATAVGFFMFRIQAKIYDRRITELTNERAALLKQYGIPSQSSKLADKDTLF